MENSVEIKVSACLQSLLSIPSYTHNKTKYPRYNENASKLALKSIVRISVTCTLQKIRHENTRTHDEILNYLHINAELVYWA